MLLPRDEIIADIDAQIGRTGGECPDWCVGIAKDGREPLFETHLLEDKNDGWVYREAFTPTSAREVIDHFVTDCGTGDDSSRRDGGGRIVHAYRKHAS
jgi:hypothetical protein